MEEKIFAVQFVHNMHMNGLASENFEDSWVPSVSQTTIIWGVPITTIRRHILAKRRPCEVCLPLPSQAEGGVACGVRGDVFV